MAVEGEGITMRTSIYCLILLIAAVTVATSPECAASTEKFGETPREKNSVSQARGIIRASLHETHYHFEASGVTVHTIRIKRDRATWVEVFGGDSQDYSLVFPEVSNFSVRDYGSNARIDFNDGGSKFIKNSMRSSNKALAIKFVDAVLTLKVAAQRPESEEADFAAFAEQVRSWLSTTLRPAMSDEARTCKLLAEDAFKRQDYSAALEAYNEALELYPMWPEGHYNAALLAAETKDYSSAADHIRRYLVLAPNAKDAPTAKDKFLLWQHKARE
jgi:tetratricopeptide (TPR) repeat protein